VRTPKFHNRQVLALRLHPDRQLRFQDEPIPEPVPGEVLIRVTEVGLCGSDRHWLTDGGIGDAVLDHPLVLGHEFAGIVETGEERGRRVAVDPAVSCGECEPCRTGRANLCPNVRFAGHGTVDGALREFIAWPSASLAPIPDRLGPGEGALVEPLAVAIHAVDLGRVGAGARVGVIGCGPIGLLVVAICKAAGATTITASDPHRHRLDAAIHLGASDVIEAVETADDAAAILATTGGRGFDVVFDAAGDPEAVDTAIATARPGGLVVLVGIPSADRTSFTASVARRKGLTLVLSRRSTDDAVRRAARLAGDRTIDLAALVSLRVPLRQGQTAFDALNARTGLKVIVEPGRSA
jgi:L-iditol 2-dehydrogenase